jgi:hypothetical protein
MKTYQEILKEARPTGGQQHTPGALKSFAKRSEREGAAYKAVHDDPNSSFNRHVNALQKHQAKWTKIDGIGVYQVPGSKVAALPANDKKSSPKWIIFNVDTRKEMTQLKKKEVLVWLSKYAVDNEGMS